MEKHSKSFVKTATSAIAPYAQLTRFSKPVGVVIINFPYLHGFYYAWSMSRKTESTSPLLGLEHVLYGTLLLTLGTFWLRSWACAWNDIADRNLDRLVARCCQRPMARGAIPLTTARLFTLCLACVWYLSLSAFCPRFSAYGPALLLLCLVYPYTKRFTDHTPVFLGICFAWGTFIGAAVGGVDPMDVISSDNFETIGKSIVLLFLHSVVWTTIFESTYAFQDIEDDVKAGIGSMAVRYRRVIRPLLAVLAVVQVALLLAVGISSSAGVLYYLLCPLGNAAVLGWMVSATDYEDPKDCGWWFANAPLMIGSLTSAGLLCMFAY